MRIRAIVHPSLLVPIVAVGVVSCGRNATHSLTTAPSFDRSVEAAASSNLVAPPFDAGNFVAGVDNAYFPLPPGKTYTYRDVSKAGEELNTVEVTRAHKTILGVAVTVVHDQVFIADGSLQ